MTLCELCGLLPIHKENGAHAHLEDGRLICLVCHEKTIYEANLKLTEAYRKDLEKALAAYDDYCLKRYGT